MSNVPRPRSLRRSRYFRRARSNDRCHYPQVDLEELRGFLTVVDKGSFVSAALEMGISRSTLRRRVESLEARTGTDLLTRTKTGVKLTSAGRVVAERGRKFMTDAAALLSAAREIKQEVSEPLRMVLPVGLPPEIAETALKLGQALNKAFQVEICVSEEPQKVSPESVDLVLFHGVDPEDSEVWRYQLLMKVPLSVMASADYLAERGTPVSLDELANHNLASWTQSGYVRSWPLRDGGEIAIKPQIVTNDASSLVHLAHAGKVMTILPDASLARIGVRDPLQNLIRVLPGEIGGSLPLYAATPSNRPRSALIGSFAAAVAELVSRMRWK